MIGVPPRALTGLGAPTRTRPSSDVTGVAAGTTDHVDGSPDDGSAAPVPAPRAAEGRSVTTGHRIARRFFDLCENPRTRERVMRTVRSSADSAVGGKLLVALLSRTVLTPLLRSRRVDATAVKVELVAAQLGGIAVLRYVTRMEPIASMPVDDLVALVGPTLQATLDAPSPG
ncbi:hypothetical protein G7072_17830 [Nocardioides sp. HDW12B]|uniref:TetR/AcrR family transcriptional regulator n=1 Tax=Nocardioides sp. HDW12B TaxID=2714939 RepID=UPI00140DA196|nr:hypothetical protein [Nocardioides sp. HDW12B]QIK67953.1 hypothetical protein G7072_17830 [Nocardioides sp. HDW12B]